MAEEMKELKTKVTSLEEKIVFNATNNERAVAVQQEQITALILN